MKKMKKEILFIALTFISLFTYGQSILQARINNLKNGKAHLWNTATINQIDTLEIKDNLFIYKKKLTEPTMFYLKFEGYNDWNSPIRLILSNELTSMTINELKASRQTESFKDSYPNKPEFSKDPNFNRQLFDFESKWLIFSDSIMKLASETNDEKRLLSKRKNLYENFIVSLHKVVKENSNKVTTAVILYEYIIRNGLVEANEAKELYLQLKENVKYSAIGITIGAYLDKEFRVKVGEPAPFFEFKDIQGKEYNLNQFKNKTLLLHFWSSTCGPCRVQNKELSKLNKKDIVVINISLDENEDQWKKAIEKDGLSKMINACDLTGKIRKDYNVHGIPIYYIIDEKGIISNKGLEEIKNLE
jgi:peroxiredoxin